MLAAGLVLTGIAAAFHVYVFVLESVVWRGPRARAAFGLSPADAETTRLLAFNQGFYNLFLAVAVVVGTVLVIGGQPTVGITMVVTGAGMMVAAGVVLVLSDRSRVVPAAAQAVPPALGVLAVLVSLAG